ncbi:hypothetical protein B5807_04075 [Epicoccum nigrum]|uniref:Heterokaryon incompatibility domain-containing protein n=1 Tax=Epicoccum nigrum TaxID=105696 RepID=A0A1Y2M4S3_EPING|nr:hypothetical protein B5807_04075 [Epicoccum nigrum]
MLSNLTVYIKSHKPGALCSRCIGLNFWAPAFNLGVAIADLCARSATCEFCRLLVRICERNANVTDGEVHFERRQSNLALLEDSYPILSIFRTPVPDPRLPVPIQIGLPELPESGSDAFFAIMNGWLEDCTRGSCHHECQASSNVKPPTRLIDVGTGDKPILKLVESASEMLLSSSYIALSHRWGEIKPHRPFSTLPVDNTGEGRDLANFKQAIPEDQLPATFKDAVICARKFGVRYLWIDSLCILQGEDGDFNVEAKKMEDVYSGAMCVIAASRANSQRDGFLKPRPQRDYVMFQRHGEKPFYVCEAIDNFSKDVIEGSLNKRGWVLQERALARRTIYFAENQTYFECGRGIRCETMTSMQNNMADFLGDPRFPSKAMKTQSRALKISYFQELYKQYSRLEFTRPDDRPFGIAGLEKCLLQAYGTKGGYGVFDDGTTADGGLFHRSLLWQRGETEDDAPKMLPIDFPAKRNIHVPSWSWMAYTGGIDYADPPFRQADWETSDVVPPWTRGDAHNTSSAPLDGSVTIPATVRKYLTTEEKAGEVRLVFDQATTSDSHGRDAYCVVVARSNQRKLDRQQKRYYVLLVMPTQHRLHRGVHAFRRIGVGYMLGKHIALDTSGTPAVIV